jgi:pyruvate formate lyase activating enzyme
MKEAKFYKKLDNNSVQCELCNHFCAINPGQSGICLARKNFNGLLYSLIYGRPVALNIDPIEKKPLFHFLPGSLTYSFGTLGCNFRCDNCQNFDISQPKEIPTIENGLTYSPEKIVSEAIASGCRSISYTYNEPTIFAEYALEVMRLARQNGLKNIWVSNGFMSKNCLTAITGLLDAVNIDLKSSDDDFYRHNCGARVAPILENLKYLKNNEIHTEITTLIIPSLSDDPDMLERLAHFIVTDLGPDTPWHLSKFSPTVSWHLDNLPSTPEEAIYNAYDCGKKAGLKYVYTGNLPGDPKENTYCPNCGEMAIRRFGYDVERMDNEGRCLKCDHYLDIID